MNEAKLANKGDVVAFSHKNREVKGKVIDKSRNSIRVKLKTTYADRNIIWDKGEEKEFRISEIEDIRKLKSGNNEQI